MAELPSGSGALVVAVGDADVVVGAGVGVATAEQAASRNELIIIIMRDFQPILDHLCHQL